jgi:hypothetical protein
LSAPFSGATVLIDIVIAVTLLEVLVLAVLHRRNGRGLAPGDFLPTLASGLFLMFALRAGLTSAGWAWVAAGLTLSGLAHAVDLRRRWRRR